MEALWSTGFIIRIFFKKNLNIVFAQETNVTVDGNDLLDLFKTQHITLIYLSTIIKKWMKNKENALFFLLAGQSSLTFNIFMKQMQFKL